MNFNKFLIIISCYLACVFALANQNDNGGDDDSKTKKTTTWVWVTTTIGGQLATISTAYSQKFISTHSSEDAKSVASGEIGLGSLSGSVGGIKTYSQTTITNANIAPSNNNVFLGIESLYTGIVGGIVLILGLL